MPGKAASVRCPAPGARVVIRDAEWVVRRVDQASDGGCQLICNGISELVREREAIFLTALEPNIQVLNPTETRLVPDPSPGFADSVLYMESQLRQAVPSDEHIHVGHGAAMDLAPYQLDPARQALDQPRQRILIADAVGLGKTLEAGILVSELIARGRGRRILVLAVKSMLAQFQKEFWNRFTIPLTRLDSIGIQRVRSRIPTSHNPFYYYDKAIISIDTLKQDAEYRTYLEQAYWDIIVIDEAHNVADRGTSSMRSRLARLLARRSDTLIMLSATPHDGKARSFASLMNMLDATAIADPGNYSQEDFRDKGLVIRRFKKDIQHQVHGAFRDRTIDCRNSQASAKEEAAYEALLAVKVAPGGGAAGASPRRDLFLVTLEKALFSSPAACIDSIDQRIRRREGAPDDRAAAEAASLRTLRAALADIGPRDYTKYQALLAAVRGGEAFNWNADNPEDRLVIFTERIETLRWLKERLLKDLKLSQRQIEILHGTMSDVEQQRVVEGFGNASHPVRLLLCSDVASEGINLHYYCHRLIHFDIPWSLMVFQQRNGRVDRYGQEQAPQIVYLVTQSANETIRGDTRILEVLVQKDEQAYRNIGDPAAFMNVRDIKAEEDITQRAIAEGEDAERFDARLAPAKSDGDDLLALFLGPAVTAGEPPPDTPDIQSTRESPPPPLSLFESDLAYCKAALHRLREKDRELRFETSTDGKDLTLDAPEDLRHRFNYFPREVIPEHWRFILTSDPGRMREAIVESRREESSWPRVHYLWRLSPVVGWLNDRMLTAFGRHEAPILAGVPGLAADETVFVLSGLVPNRKSHPLIYEWVGVIHQGGRFKAPIPFKDVLARTGLGRNAIANWGRQVDIDALQRLLPEAVAKAREKVIERRNAFEKAINTKLGREMDAFDKHKALQFRQLELELERSGQGQAQKQKRAEQGRLDINQVFDDYLEWIQDTMTTEREPWIKVICVMTGGD